MKIAIAFVACVACIALFAVSQGSTSSLFQQKNWGVEQSFMRFIAENKKSYQNRAEYEKRLQAFSDFLDRIEAQRAFNPEGEYGITQFADWTEEEFIALQTRFPAEDDLGDYVFEQSNAADVDWRTKNNGKYLSAVKNQGACGSCWAFSAVAAAESATRMANVDTEVYSEQQVVDCFTNGCSGCSGGFTYLAFGYIDKAGQELEFERNYKYTARQSSCKYQKGLGKDLKTSYDVVKPNNLGDALQKGPVSVAVWASDWSGYNGGVHKCSRKINSKYELNHEVQAVGKTQNSWIIKNSWGNRWGQKGFIEVSNDRQYDCGTTLDAYFLHY